MNLPHVSAVSILLVSFVSYVQMTQAAFERVPLGSRSVGASGAVLALERDSWSGTTNPGLLASVPQPVVSAFYSPVLFGIPDLGRYAFVVVEPTGFGAFSLSASRFGNDLLHETTVSLSYARNLTRRFRAGVAVEYDLLWIERYGTASCIGVTAGFEARLSDEFAWAAAIANINGPVLGAAREPLPQTISVGVRYQPIREGGIEMDLFKDLRYTAEVHIGLEYTLLEVLSLRGGTAGELGMYSAGLGVVVGPLQFDYAMSEHRELGPTHHVSLTVELGFL